MGRRTKVKITLAWRFRQIDADISLLFQFFRSRQGRHRRAKRLQPSRPAKPVPNSAHVPGSGTPPIGVPPTPANPNMNTLFVFAPPVGSLE